MFPQGLRLRRTTPHPTLCPPAGPEARDTEQERGCGRGLAEAGMGHGFPVLSSSDVCLASGR